MSAFEFFISVSESVKVKYTFNIAVAWQHCGICAELDIHSFKSEFSCCQETLHVKRHQVIIRRFYNVIVRIFLSSLIACAVWHMQLHALLLWAKWEPCPGAFFVCLYCDFSQKSETLAIRKGIKEGIFQWELQMFSNPLVLPQWRLAILMFREADKVSAGIEILRYT